ncbi:ABC transporter ATP-binding protein [Neobacillus sp. 179-C4.2 HS]|jgi:oligopeptide/dipeptide ABC transporter ATP-binding protein|uniref:ABC transporter ATP-binding protein n=1 Tax=Neobacillus driksii TaxID=3035913 RepID=A0ABV4YRR7_9BACI|nr:ABC transporter ATP-binding protein [Neobacillus sp. 179.-C4.2 HS]MDP5195113.1 ABC transporter ATP-binding protein [Neobacillus sp. 179.-C4.2 HS]
MTSLLSIENLKVGRPMDGSFSTVLEDVSFSINKGEFVAVVGESGCGKSMTALSIMGLLPKIMNVHSGSIYYKGKDITKLSKKEINKIRGKEISMIFQEPMTSLNPSFTIGNQLAEVFKYHTNYSKSEIRQKSIEVLEQVEIPDAKEKLGVYPHELSGGMRQRVMIAMALACSPNMLIADEPTTALDVTIQAQILNLLVDLQKNLNMAVMMITHDMGVVAETCQRVIVMYAGQVIEAAPVKDLFKNPAHPYTKALLSSVPVLGQPDRVLNAIEGSVPGIDDMPNGCRFHPRCNMATNECLVNEPQLESHREGRWVRCWNKG